MDAFDVIQTLIAILSFSGLVGFGLTMGVAIASSLMFPHGIKWSSKSEGTFTGTLRHADCLCAKTENKQQEERA